MMEVVYMIASPSWRASGIVLPSLLISWPATDLSLSSSLQRSSHKHGPDSCYAVESLQSLRIQSIIHNNSMQARTEDRPRGVSPANRVGVSVILALTRASSPPTTCGQTLHKKSVAKVAINSAMPLWRGYRSGPGITRPSSVVPRGTIAHHCSLWCSHCY